MKHARRLHAPLYLLLASTVACDDDDAKSPTDDTDPPAACGDATEDLGEACDDGNDVTGDGCEPDCTLTTVDPPDDTDDPVVADCAPLAPLPSAVCAVTTDRGGDGAKLLVGTVLTPGRAWRGGQVAIDAEGWIRCVGCDCATEVPDATVITCPQGVISPGLINAHDHITFTQDGPSAVSGERYEHRHDWRLGKRGHTAIPTAGGATADQVRWGELRFLMGGATSTVASGASQGLLRNLDRADAMEGLDERPVRFETFPLGDSDGTQLTSGCAYPSIPTADDVADASELHVAEGIDQVARNEFLCMSSTASGGEDLTLPQSAFIHGVGLTAADYADMAAGSTGLIWSPRSNISLYGDTAQVTAAAALGVQIALSTDWIASGSMNLLRELRCADQLNAEYYDHRFSDEALWKMVTLNPATITATDDRLGVLAPGHLADVAIFDGSSRDAYRAVIEAEPADVALVLRGGEALYGDEALVSALAAGCDALDVCGAAKQVCAMAEIGQDLPTLQAAVGDVYPAFFCATPDDEPSCVPTRAASVSGSTIYTGVASADDHDGDGIVDEADNCPAVFNPIRPLDGGAQGDADGDGDGDVCDPCPLDPGAASCERPNPDDRDGDGDLNYADNCPSLSNAGQEDRDGDGKGDVCDPCPDAPNPGLGGCPATIYAIKDGTVPPGTPALITDVIVTARTASAYFVQIVEGDPGFMGVELSGLYVFHPGNAVARGDRVDIDGTVTDFFGLIELADVTATVTASGAALPQPALALPADLVTGGPRAAALEGVLVRVEDVRVSSSDPVSRVFTLDGGLPVDDALHLVTPFPAVDDAFASITGVLTLSRGDNQLLPRDAADVVPGP